jgi:subtilisin family serine protease
MEIDYVILKRTEKTVKRGFGRPAATNNIRKPSAAPDDLDVLGAAASVETSQAKSSFSVHQERLSTAQAADILRDSSLVGAPAMPMSLVTPVAAADDGGDALAGAKAQGMSWGLKAIGADQSDLSGAGVTVAVLDTGIDPGHAAFKGMTLEQQDFTGSASSNDEHGHGTHCAGTIFGRDVDGVRIGVARGVNHAFIGKVLDKNGFGPSSAVARAIEWAVGNKVDVLSMSVSFDYPGMVDKLEREHGLPAALAGSRALRIFRDNLRLFDSLMMFAQAQSAFGTGCVFVAASGNESQADENPDFRIEVSLPAASNGIVSVGAMKRMQDKLDIAPFSNINPIMGAPGVDIVSARLGGGLVAASGTSMACPHVAGVAALWWQRLRQRGSANAQMVAANLIASARADGSMPGLGAQDYGAGVVHVP